MDDDFYLNKKIVEERRKRNLEKQGLYSRNKLKDDFKKKITTTMIGALASIEKYFGERLDLNVEKVDEDWEDCRQEILDRGNKQIRAMMDELDCYDVTWNKYKYNFKIRREDD